MAATTGAGGLTDTDVLIDAARGLAEAISLLDSHQAASGIHVSIISAMELIAGYRNRAELTMV